MPDMSFVDNEAEKLLNPLSFNQRYHQETVEKGLEMVNPDGSVTTVFVKGMPVGDKIYNVPYYDRDTQTIMTDEQALQKWMPFIERGEIEGFPLEFEGPIEQHPANIRAREEHKMMDEYGQMRK